MKIRLRSLRDSAVPSGIHIRLLAGLAVMLFGIVNLPQCTNPASDAHKESVRQQHAPSAQQDRAPSGSAGSQKY